MWSSTLAMPASFNVSRLHPMRRDSSTKSSAHTTCFEMSSVSDWAVYHAGEASTLFGVSQHLSSVIRFNDCIDWWVPIWKERGHIVYSMRWHPRTMTGWRPRYRLAENWTLLFSRRFRYNTFSTTPITVLLGDFDGDVSDDTMMTRTTGSRCPGGKERMWKSKMWRGAHGVLVLHLSKTVTSLDIIKRKKINSVMRKLACYIFRMEALLLKDGSPAGWMLKWKKSHCT